MAKPGIDKKKKAKDVRSDTNITQVTSLDPHLTELFNSSLSRAEAVETDSRKKQQARRENHAITEVAQSLDSDSAEESISDEGSASASESSIASSSPEPPSKSRKRKRGVRDDDELEERYLNRLAAQQTTRNASTQPESTTQVDRSTSPQSQGTQAGSDNELHASEEDDESTEIPQHETVSQVESADEVEKASRTVFLGNVSTDAIKSNTSRRTLMDHLESFFPNLPKEHEHRVVSLRFRSTAFSDTSLPKKASFVKKDLLDATTQSTNAYAEYDCPLAAREAIKRLNASVVLDRHLRVDGVAHPSKIDHRRCVFVGNLAFVNDDSNIKAIEEEQGHGRGQKKSKPPGDVEEGLWRQFKIAGAVESVRVIRDKTTRVGKGFAYVQFENPNSVEKALLFNDQKYPPLLPRKLRVTRAKSLHKTASNLTKNTPSRIPSQKGVYRAKPSSEVKSIAGRAGKLFGRAGANKFFDQTKNENSQQSVRSFKSPEAIVFEGHRAKEGKKPSGLAKTKKTKRTKRSTAYRSRMRKG